ncbi:helix-turn-helix domain-containing protein [Nocardia gipuzkoensis]
MWVPDFVAISSRLIELLTLSLDDRSTSTQTQLALLARAAEGYVAERCEDPTVTPTSISVYLGCSLRQLQLALQTVGTSPAQLLRNHRLDRARRRPQNPFDTSGISEIAFGSGFSSLSAFGAVFRNQFGTSPRQMRAVRPSGQERVVAEATSRGDKRFVIPKGSRATRSNVYPTPAGPDPLPPPALSMHLDGSATSPQCRSGR